MSFMVDICYAVLEEMYSETGLEKVLAGVTDAIFGSYAADIYIGRVQKSKNLSE